MRKVDPVTALTLARELFRWTTQLMLGCSVLFNLEAGTGSTFLLQITGTGAVLARVADSPLSLGLIPGRLIPAARAPGVRRLSFFEIVVTSLWESSDDLLFVGVQHRPGL
jgi:hypothetical protein